MLTRLRLAAVIGAALLNTACPLPPQPAGPALAPAPAPASARAPAPELVAIAATAGPVSFDHRQHDRHPCSICHRTNPPAKVALGKEKAHQLCKGCHLEEGGPVACAGCHRMD